MYDRVEPFEGDRLSKYAQTQFEAAGLAHIATRVCQAQRLSLADAERLATASLPLLAKLVGLRPGHVLCDRPALDPVLFLPMSDWPATGGSEAAVRKAVHGIREAASQLASLVERDQRVREFGDCVRTLRVATDVPKNRLRDTFRDAGSDRVAVVVHLQVSYRRRTVMLD